MKAWLWAGAIIVGLAVVFPAVAMICAYCGARWPLRLWAYNDDHDEEDNPNELLE